MSSLRSSKKSLAVTDQAVVAEEREDLTAAV